MSANSRQRWIFVFDINQSRTETIELVQELTFEGHRHWLKKINSLPRPSIVSERDSRKSKYLILKVLEATFYQKILKFLEQWIMPKTVLTVMKLKVSDLLVVIKSKNDFCYNTYLWDSHTIFCAKVFWYISKLEHLQIIVQIHFSRESLFTVLYVY